ncbi:unnamed protein product [marine sediment metagenome]|uniref:Uncharacterized protein n=1 Tax=marine sediment metagenome TaxID=412755 RepID=X1CU56_9ZZZZ
MANDRFNPDAYYGSGFDREQMIRKRRAFEEHLSMVQRETGMSVHAARRYIEQLENQRNRSPVHGQVEAYVDTRVPSPAVLNKAVNLLQESCNRDGLTRRNRLLILAGV